MVPQNARRIDARITRERKMGEATCKTDGLKNWARAKKTTAKKAKVSYGDLHRYADGEYLRAATADEYDESRRIRGRDYGWWRGVLCGIGVGESDARCRDDCEGVQDWHAQPA